MKTNLDPRDPLPALAGKSFCKEHGWNDKCSEVTCPTMMLFALKTSNDKMAVQMGSVMDHLVALGLKL